MSPFGTDLPFTLWYDIVGTYAYPKEFSHLTVRALLFFALLVKRR